jgi:hypothetical protein
MSISLTGSGGVTKGSDRNTITFSPFIVNCTNVPFKKFDATE